MFVLYNFRPPLVIILNFNDVSAIENILFISSWQLQQELLATYTYIFSDVNGLLSVNASKTNQISFNCLR